jgi:hypothetical protein
VNPRVLKKALGELGKNYTDGKLERSFYSQNDPTERPSLFWRGDCSLLGSKVPRWADRVFLDEVTGSNRRLIGFANLRPLHKLDVLQIAAHKKMPATAEAFLSPPLYMSKSPDYQIYAAGHYGELYGEKVPEEGTCFIMPYRLMGGVCAHAAISMCLVMASRFGFRVPAVHEMGYVVAKNTPKNVEERDELERSGRFQVRPLDLGELHSLVRTPHVGGEALLESHDVAGGDSDAVLGEVMHQYLLQELPIILAIHYDELYAERWRRPRLKHKVRYRLSRVFPKTWAQTKDCRNHAVVLVGVGYKRQDGSSPGALNEFVFHDPNQGPYLKKPVGHLVKAARMLEAWPNHLAFLVLVPPGVTRKIGELATAYVNLCGRPLGHKNREPFDNLLEPENPDLKASDVQYRLLRKNRLWEAYFENLPCKDNLCQRLKDAEADLPDWIWAIEHHVTVKHHATTGESFLRRDLIAVWFFDAEDSYERVRLWQQWRIAEGLFAMWHRGTFACFLPGFPREGIRVHGRLRGLNRGGLT